MHFLRMANRLKRPLLKGTQMKILIKMGLAMFLVVAMNSAMAGGAPAGAPTPPPGAPTTPPPGAPTPP